MSQNVQRWIQSLTNLLNNRLAFIVVIEIGAFRIKNSSERLF